MKEQREQKDKSQLINERIRAPQLQLIAANGENVGIVSRTQALAMAQEAGLDLVLLAESGKDGLPVVKIMDFGKSLYEKKKKQHEAKKNQKVVLVKEIKLRPKIGDHDYQIKMRQMLQFLKQGNKVKVTLNFKGRENIGKDDRGAELFEKIRESVAEDGLEKRLLIEGESKMRQVWSRTYYLKP